jgi:hypothetical protein
MNETIELFREFNVSSSGMLTVNPDWNKQTPFQDVLFRVLFLIQYFLIFPILAACLLYVRKWMRSQGIFMSTRELDGYIENGANGKIDNDDERVSVRIS